MNSVKRIFSVFMVVIMVTANVICSGISAGAVNDADSKKYSLVINDTLTASFSADSSIGGISLFSRTEFDGCYGNQISGVAREIYDSLVKNYAADKTPGTYTYTFEAPFIFDVEISGNDIVMNDVLEEVVNEIRCSVQVSMDAFLYDHPEVFWLKNLATSYGVSTSGDPVSGYTGKIEAITIIPKEIYDGASDFITQYDTAVESALGSVTVTESRYETLKNIHDYICDMAWYNLVDEQKVHSSAPFFIGDGGVVCEGYAKAYKILCDRLEIPCVLVSGYAEGAHMWNYVQMDDGKWYLVDATWDDQENKIYDTYFLADANTVGFKDVPISEERTESNDFSGTGIFSFTYPVLSTSSYLPHVHSWETEYTVDEAPTCTTEGKKSKMCTIAGCKVKLSEVIPATGHEDSDYNAECDICFESVNDIEIGENLIKLKKIDDIYLSFTATADGRYVVHSDDAYVAISVYNEDKSEYEHDADESESMCNLKKGQKVYWRIKNLSYKDIDSTITLEYLQDFHVHDFSSITVIKDDDCTVAGIRISSCSCGASSTTVIPATEHTLVIDKAVSSTCSRTGLTEGLHCSVCKAVIKNQDITDKKPHTYTTTTTKASLSQNGKSETKCTTCGYVSKTTVINAAKTVKLSATSYTYNGKAKTPSVTVKDSKGNTISKDNYTVTYPKKRKSIGKYTVTVTFKGNYSGTKKLTFNIIPAKANISKLTAGSKALTATWKTLSGITGYELQYSTSKKFTKKTTKTVTIKKAKTKKTTLKKLKKGKKYYVRIRAFKTVSKKPVFGAWSAVKSLRVK